MDHIVFLLEKERNTIRRNRLILKPRVLCPLSVSAEILTPGGDGWRRLTPLRKVQEQSCLSVSLHYTMLRRTANVDIGYRTGIAEEQICCFYFSRLRLYYQTCIHAPIHLNATLPLQPSQCSSQSPASYQFPVHLPGGDLRQRPMHQSCFTNVCLPALSQVNGFLLLTQWHSCPAGDLSLSHLPPHPS